MASLVACASVTGSSEPSEKMEHLPGSLSHSFTEGPAPRKGPFSVVVCENVAALGVHRISSPRDLPEIHVLMKRLASEYTRGKQATVNVSFFIDTTDNSEFLVVDAKSGQCLHRFSVASILHYSQGSTESSNAYIVLTYPTESPADTLEDVNNGGDKENWELVNPISPEESTASEDKAIISSDTSEYNCYVFKCSTSFEASRIVGCLGRISTKIAQRRSPGQVPTWKSMSTPLAPEDFEVGLRLHVDIQEEDPRSATFISVPKEKPNLFKLRRNLEKSLVIGISQTSGSPPLRVCRCIGVGLAFGRFIQDVELTMLTPLPEGLPSEEATALVSGASFVTKASWAPTEPQFEHLNTVTDRDQFVFFTIVCHLIFDLLSKPVSLYCVCRAKVFRQDESFWLSQDRRPCTEDNQLQLTDLTDETGRIYLNKLTMTNLISPFSDVMRSFVKSDSPDKPQNASTQPADDESDDDEPLLSGNGIVSSEITDSDLMVAWGGLISDWQAKLKALATAPNLSSVASMNPAASDSFTSGPDIAKLGIMFARRIRSLVRRGIPEALRAETWQLLVGHHNIDTRLSDAYRILSTKPCQFDAAIQRDLPRTFPAHDFFKDRKGQEILFQLNRVYALYDEEVGYSQGISFIAAALLLHLPEDQAFCVLVKIMSNYGVRLLFTRNSDGLFRSLYQYEQLVQDQLPDVAKAFEDVGIEAHMFASQWLLTLFTAKFPLNLVFHILDVFLCEGMQFIFKVMITLTRVSRRDLLGLDFEGTLKYFRVTLPKRFRSPEASKELIATALTAKVSSKKLARFAKDWAMKKAEADALSSPLRALQRESWQLRDQCSRLEKENETLADEVLTSKTNMQKQIEKLEDMVESLKIELFAAQKELVEKQEECDFMEKETRQVKNMLRTILEQHKAERQQQAELIQEYKTITSNLSKRVDSLENSTERICRLPSAVVETVMQCSGECRASLDSYLPGWDQTGDSGLTSHAFNPDGRKEDDEEEEVNEEVTSLRRRVKELELDLAHNKVKLVDEQCQRQELSHRLQQTTAELECCRRELEVARNSNPRQWLAKKWTNMRTSAAAPAPDAPSSPAQKQRSPTSPSSPRPSTLNKS
uniref:Rab-GAP TBC domain-containing protein n=2 Tax=Schistocephalus solidus TaxID=70667 RepID=A0A0X3PPI6_SCHSO